ncbi:S-adenosyl-L-methionine-dependent methyltransferase [Phanerochaete sordida]|uniref:tRNA N(3)-methylcytidine methyltransferase n=1 Tax=Phanerochaete sordida TaxID=48140 RepID=A0A9P3GEA8_9APHY|nr:S-adenosyl-L-methionine-dependent methyltransferase [Phanerochaete sordida]
MATENAGVASSSKASRTASSVHDVTAEKPPFGARFLTEDQDVWSQNAWDHVPPPDDQDEIIAAAIAKQKSAPVPEEEKQKYNDKPAKHWDNFYKANAGNFFRNRKWLQLEFPELVRAVEPDAGPLTIAEIGCGAGNAVFPLLSANQNPHLSLRAYDYASHAVKVVQTNPLYLDPPVGNIQAAVWDLSSDSLPPGLEAGTVDIVILIFVLSALHPDEWRQAITNVHKLLKPGGRVLFRDYGRHDLTQLRFKAGRLLADNFYIRGDKTRVYFFELDELARLFTGAGLPASFQTTDTETVEEEDGAPASGQHTPAAPGTPPADATPAADLDAAPSAPPAPAAAQPAPPQTNDVPDGGVHPTGARFAIEQLGVDRRLIVNRKRQLKMYRVWMQGKFRKLEVEG